MAQATLAQINDRIYAIDELVFEGSIGQRPMSTEGRAELQHEADELMRALAKGLHESGAGEFQDLIESRQKVRDLKWIAAVSARYVELHPEPQPEVDAIFAAWSHAHERERPMEGKVSQEIARIFASVFVELPSETAPTRGSKNGLLSRIIRPWWLRLGVRR